jgi:hypothetical protein
MSASSLSALAYASALAGLACFLWPIVQRLRGRGEDGPGGPHARTRWAGFGLTALALILQRLAAGAA